MAQLEVFFSSDYMWVYEPLSLVHHSVFNLIRVFLHDDTLHLLRRPPCELYISCT